MRFRDSEYYKLDSALRKFGRKLERSITDPSLSEILANTEEVPFFDAKGEQPEEGALDINSLVGRQMRATRRKASMRSGQARKRFCWL